MKDIINALVGCRPVHRLRLMKIRVIFSVYRDKFLLITNFLSGIYASFPEQEGNLPGMREKGSFVGVSTSMICRDPFGYVTI
jgi:hypothetical protein